MAGIVLNGGLDYLATVDAATDCATWVVSLYSNNHAPVATDTSSAFTVINTAGVVPQTPGYTVAPASGGSKTYTSALMNFIATANAGSAYGYVVKSAGGTALFAELMSGGPFSLTNAGLGVQLTSVLSDQSP